MHVYVFSPCSCVHGCASKVSFYVHMLCACVCGRVGVHVDIAVSMYICVSMRVSMCACGGRGLVYGCVRVCACLSVHACVGVFVGRMPACTY